MYKYSKEYSRDEVYKLMHMAVLLLNITKSSGTNV